MKAIVVTGSINAMTTGEDVGKRVYDSSEWLPVGCIFTTSLGSQTDRNHSYPLMMQSKPSIHTFLTVLPKPSLRKPFGNTSKKRNPPIVFPCCYQH